MEEEKTPAPAKAEESGFNRADSLLRVNEALVAVRAALSGLSNREVKDVLAMACAPENLRVIAMDRPIGRPVNAPPVPKDGTGGSKKASANRQKSPWKRDPRWIAAEEARATTVASLKSLTPEKEDERKTLVALLREQESALAALKKELRGFRED